MVEKALKGSFLYWVLVLALLGAIGVGVICYIIQFNEGLAITGLSRDVTWGFYISQFTFLVGVAASAVMVVLPYYLHDYKKFGKITVFGEFLAISAVLMCMAFIFVDMGQPTRVTNVFLYPSPSSMMFWDSVSLFGYLIINVVIGWIALTSERKGVKPPKWIRTVSYISIPWAVSIHTVTAFLYCGLPGRGFWLSAIMAPRFLASAFAAGPALLIILMLVVKKFTQFDPGSEALQKLAQIVTYAMIANVFFLGLEIFTAVYSGIPEHTHHFKYLFFGINGQSALVPFMWGSVIFSFAGIFMLLVPEIRKNENFLPIACVLVFFGAWLDKGLGLVTGGFVPGPTWTHGEPFTEYVPTILELLISLGVYGVGFFVLTILYKIATSVKEEVA